MAVTETVVIEKLVHGGQGIGTLADGRRVFVWNALPGEKLTVELTKNKRNLAEGIAIEIIESSANRITPKDEAYLSTSPWQIMTFTAENKYKQQILLETMQREHVKYDAAITMYAGTEAWNYRNKMEYSFWADDAGLHLALYNRGTHFKQIVEGSSIAVSVIDVTADAILSVLNMHNIRGSQLKTVVIRANQAGKVVAALFVKDESFPQLPELQDVAEGVVVYYSTPKSPASVITKELYRYGDLNLSDNVLSADIGYDVNSFFQVNVPVFTEALRRIATSTKGISPIVDMYSGVGTIGIPIHASTLIDIDSHNVQMAKQNVGGGSTEVIHASAETALEHITSNGSLIVDPPRAGLHTKVIQKIREVTPGKIVYLSCNPITQARDIALLQDIYNIVSVEGFNFFPRTPHIESLVVLEKS